MDSNRLLWLESHVWLKLQIDKLNLIQFENKIPINGLNLTIKRNKSNVASSLAHTFSHSTNHTWSNSCPQNHRDTGQKPQPVYWNIWGSTALSGSLSQPKSRKHLELLNSKINYYLASRLGPRNTRRDDRRVYTSKFRSKIIYTIRERSAKISTMTPGFRNQWQDQWDVIEGSKTFSTWVNTI